MVHKILFRNMGSIHLIDVGRGGLLVRPVVCGSRSSVVWCGCTDKLCEFFLSNGLLVGGDWQLGKGETGHEISFEIVIKK